MNWETGEISKEEEGVLYRRFVEIAAHRRLDPRSTAAFIDSISYLFSWSFFDAHREFPTPQPFRGQTMCLVDCQALVQGGSCQMSISLDISAIKPLLSWNVSDEERSMIQHTIGVNVRIPDPPSPHSANITRQSAYLHLVVHGILDGFSIRCKSACCRSELIFWTN